MEQTKQGRAIDPICGMSVDPDKTEFKYEHNGKTYYFCAPHCRDEFERREMGKQSGETKDVICGMAVDPAKTDYSLSCNGQMFYFCSEGCLRTFQRKLEQKNPKTAFGRWLSRLAETNEEEFGSGGGCCH